MTVFLVLIVLLAVIGGAGFWYWKRNQTATQASGIEIDKIIEILPPLNLPLFKAKVGGWKENERLHKDEERLKKAGATQQGYFFTTDHTRSIQYSFWNFKSVIGIVIKEEASLANELGVARVQYGYEVFIRLKNGMSVTVMSHVNLTPGLPKQKQHPVAVLQNDDVIEFVKKVKAQIKDPSLLAKIADTRSAYLDLVFTKHLWYWQEPQLLSNEMQVLLTTRGITVSEELMQSLLYYARFTLAECIESQVLERFPIQAKLDEDKWNDMRDKIVVVHEKMPGPMVAAALLQLMGSITQSQETALENLENQDRLENPIASFNELFSKWNGQYKAKCIAKGKFPFSTEIFLKT